MEVAFEENSILHCGHFWYSYFHLALQPSSCGHAVQVQRPVLNLKNGKVRMVAHEDKALEVCAPCPGQEKQLHRPEQ